MFLGVFGVVEFEYDIIFCQIRHIYQYYISIVIRITFFKNVKNTHYVIRSKSCDNPDKHVLSNKMDVKFEFNDPKNQ